jgi:hypothetical protein
MAGLTARTSDGAEPDVNFLTEEETGDRIAAAYGASLKRLAQVKRRWDPGNLFRMNENIAPAAG